MMHLVSFMAARWLTPAGLLVVTAGVLAIHFGGLDAAPALAPGVGILTLNLLAGLFTESRLHSNPGLLLFHLALLGVTALAVIGYLIRFEARIEIVQGGHFDPAALQAVKAGRLHPGRPENIHFIQGPFTVDYDPGLERSHTRSQIRLPDGQGGWKKQEVGDDHPLIIGGYRLYTTWNKGFALVLSWLPKQGSPMTGAVHLPPYPGIDWNQENKWTVPGTDKLLRLRLELPPRPPDEQAWQLRGDRRSDATLLVQFPAGKQRLAPGEQLELAEGMLRFDEVRGWMGYKVYYDPTLPWMFWIAMIGISGLAWHYGCRTQRPSGSVSALYAESWSAESK